MKKFFDCGIDLGTTNSCIAVPNNDNTCTIIESTTAPMQVTPSAVWVSKKGHITVGRKAYYCTNIGEVKKEFKRDMGTETVYTFKGSEKQLSPEDLSAEILKALRSDAVKRRGTEMNDTIITVPAAFSMIQCEATKRAAALAGFRNCILLQEPIAAAIAYGAQPDAKDQYWLVFDYGGGTLDVSIISTNDGRLENINSRGNNHMGGKDLDRLLYEKVILPKLQREYDVPNGFDESTTAKILLDVEGCKIELSSQEETLFELFDLEDDSGEYIEFSCKITKDEFNRAIESVVDDAVNIARKALIESGVSEQDICKIVLVGGTTFVPLVREKLQAEFDAPLDCTVNPMTVVAMGAGLFAASTVVDDDIKEEEQANDGECFVDIEYNPVTADAQTNICGKISNAKQAGIAQICIDCIASESSESALWSSGWVDMLSVDEGIFDVDVKVCNLNSKNTYRISARGANGTTKKLKGYIFEILHKENSLIASAPPMPFAMGLLVTDGTDNMIDWFVQKNTKLPVSVTQTYTLNKTLSPDDDDECVVRLYEGEDTYNPDANTLLRIIRIKGKDRLLEKGTEVEITIDIDISRCMSISCFVPAYGCELLSEEVTNELESKKNYEQAMDAVEKKLKETKFTLDTLKNKGIDVHAYMDEYNEINNDFDKYYDLVDVDNDQVELYLVRFFKFQTKVILLERDSREERAQTTEAEQVQRFENNISRYGGLAQQKEFEALKAQLSKAKDPDSRKFVINKMDQLDTNVLNNSFEWLQSIFFYYDRAFIAYTDPQKADYWKSEARKAVAAGDANALKAALIRLQNLRLQSASESQNVVLADLVKK